MLLGLIAAAALTGTSLNTEIERSIQESPYGTLPVGLSPGDPVLLLRQWQQKPQYGAAPARQAARLAIAAERLARYEEAIERWRAIARDPKATAELRSEALLADARLNITRDPAAADAALAQLPPEASGGIAARLLKARVLMMQGRWAEAEAMQDAAAGPAQRTSVKAGEAVLRDMAITAGHRGDLRETTGLMAMSGVERVPVIRPAVLQCHQADDLRPDDIALVEVEVGVLGELTAATPVWASRPGAMAHKLAARLLDGTAEMQHLARSDMRPVYTARAEIGCANVDLLANDYDIRRYTYQLTPEGAAVPIDAPSFRTAQTLTDVLAAGAPLEVLAILMRRAANAEGNEAVCGEVERLANALPANASADALAALASAASACENHSLSYTLLKKIAEGERFAIADRRAVAGQLAGSAMSPDREKWADFARLPGDHCWRADMVSQKGLHIEPSAYPELLRKLSITGLYSADFRRDAEGNMSGFRTVASSPARLFEKATADMLSRQRMVPVTRKGKPFACQDTATISWKLDAPDDD